MKELTVQEKAKRYDDAIKLIKDNLNTLNEIAETGAEVISIQSIKNCFYKAFPELCESEDEKVRKAILELVRQSSEVLDKQNQNNMIAWLEKQGQQKLPIEKLPEEMKSIGESLGFTTQKECDEYNQMVSELIMSDDDRGEQKPIAKIQLGKKYKCIASPRYSTFMIGEIYKPEDEFLCSLMNFCYGCFEPIEDGEQKPSDKVEPKFKVGDWVVVSTTKGDRAVQIASVEYFKDGSPSYTTTEGRWFGNRTKARLLTDKDVETITLPESKIIVKQKHAKWSEEELTDFEKSLKHVMEETLECGDIHNLKADAELLLNLIQKPSDNDMVEALCTEYEKGRADAIAEMRKEWSEEDDYNLQCMIAKVTSDIQKGNVGRNQELIDWLKFIKQRIGG